ncbi:flagellin [Ectothiorhodospira haloalkaliphila]|uniref:flagellin n=1 Tax=Ectothiorhodospira haloalkaliphila TaxID=421628 RepID=UPI001EE7FF85|nr:flagellin [Ectothiorhodospira haloalkaliphila]MCG5524767.1 flagellin [Ectothiorhodospira haloalkaliphila]
MSQVINTNIASLNAQRNLNATQSQLQTSLERLSSGLRINSAKDDAAGLAISERFTAQINGLNQAARNANDGISFAQTAEGGLDEIGNLLQRVRQLAVQSANDTNSSSDRQAIQNEVRQAIDEIDRIAQSTEFNDAGVLNGSLSDLTFQVGANQGQTIVVDGVDARASSLGANVLKSTGSTLNTVDSGAIKFDELVTGNTLEINGVTFTFNNTSADNNFTTFDGLVNAINQKGDETNGVRATRAETTTVNLGKYSAPSGAAETFTINGTSITIADGGDIESAVAAINAKSGTTGVTAERGGNDNDELVLVDSSGKDIVLAGMANDLIASNAGTGTFISGLQLTSDLNETLTVGGTNAPDVFGLDNTNVVNERLSDIDVSTRADASAAINTLDFVLGQVSSLRADLGAVQNRFESTVANLQVSSENLSASRSRILDADFASETASLTRAQILQQAGTSVLAQANQAPNNVLALLQ